MNSILVVINTGEIETGCLLIYWFVRKDYEVKGRVYQVEALIYWDDIERIKPCVELYSATHGN